MGWTRCFSDAYEDTSMSLYMSKETAIKVNAEKISESQHESEIVVRDHSLIKIEFTKKLRGY